jgi:hypothetical protein
MNDHPIIVVDAEQSLAALAAELTAAAYPALFGMPSGTTGSICS